MKTFSRFIYAQIIGAYKIFLLINFLTALFLIRSHNILAQTKEEINAIDRIALYGGYMNSTDLTDLYLAQYGFKTPNTLIKPWKSFSAVRKLDYAFKSAEKANNGNGERLLTMLSQDIASNYESALSEPSLKPYLQKKAISSKIIFASLTLQEAKVNNLSPSIEKAILKITKYTDAGALGSIQTLMVRYFGLSEDLTYQILTTSDSELTALRRGLSNSIIPPTHKQRLNKIVDQLIIDYESVAKDNVLSKYSSEYINLKNTKNTQQVVAENKVLQTEISKKIQSIKVVRPSDAEISSALKEQGYTDEAISIFIASIDAEQAQNLSQVFIPNNSDPYRQNIILKENLKFVKTPINNTDIATAIIKSRPALAAKICSRCGLPKSFPLCLSVRRR